MKKSLLILGCLLLASACNLGVPSPTVESPLTQAPQPAPEGDSSTQAVAATATFASPPPLYFTEEFDTPSSYWVFKQPGGSQSLSTFFEGGSLRINTTTPETWFIGIHTAHSYTDVFVRATAALSPSGSIGLICRYDEATGWYEFNAASDGTYSLLLGQWLTPDIAKYIPIVSDHSGSIVVTQPVELGFFCNGTFLELYVNNSLLRRFDVTNYGLSEGMVGITVSSFTDPMTASFERINVSEK